MAVLMERKKNTGKKEPLMKEIIKEDSIASPEESSEAPA
jgi:hypothetical protein